MAVGAPTANRWGSPLRSHGWRSKKQARLAASNTTELRLLAPATGVRSEAGSRCCQCNHPPPHEYQGRRSRCLPPWPDARERFQDAPVESIKHCASSRRKCDEVEWHHSAQVVSRPMQLNQNRTSWSKKGRNRVWMGRLSSNHGFQACRADSKAATCAETPVAPGTPGQPIIRWLTQAPFRAL